MVALFLFLKGITGALAPLSYLVFNNFTILMPKNDNSIVYTDQNNTINVSQNVYSAFSFPELVKSILIRRLSIFRCSLDNLDDVVAIAIKAEFHTTSLDFSVAGKELNDREKARLEELYIASRSGKYKTSSSVN